MAFTLFLYASEHQSDAFLISLHFCYFVLFFFRMLSRVFMPLVYTPFVLKVNAKYFFPYFPRAET